MPPVISRNEALVIWMSRTAIKAPSMEPITAIHVTAMEGSHDNPGTMRPVASPKLPESKTIFTGTRWTILMKFPVHCRVVAENRSLQFLAGRYPPSR